MRLSMVRYSIRGAALAIGMGLILIGVLYLLLLAAIAIAVFTKNPVYIRQFLQPLLVECDASAPFMDQLVYCLKASLGTYFYVSMFFVGHKCVPEGVSLIRKGWTV